MASVTKAELVLTIAALKGQLATARAERDAALAVQTVVHTTPAPSRAAYYTYVAQCRAQARVRNERVCSYKAFDAWCAA